VGVQDGKGRKLQGLKDKKSCDGKSNRGVKRWRKNRIRGSGNRRGRKRGLASEWQPSLKKKGEKRPILRPVREKPGDEKREGTDQKIKRLQTGSEHPTQGPQTEEKEKLPTLSSAGGPFVEGKHRLKK